MLIFSFNNAQLLIVLLTAQSVCECLHVHTLTLFTHVKTGITFLCHFIMKTVMYSKFEKALCFHEIIVVDVGYVTGIYYY